VTRQDVPIGDTAPVPEQPAPEQATGEPASGPAGDRAPEPPEGRAEAPEPGRPAGDPDFPVTAGVSATDPEPAADGPAGQQDSIGLGEPAQHEPPGDRAGTGDSPIPPAETGPDTLERTASGTGVPEHPDSSVWIPLTGTRAAPDGPEDTTGWHRHPSGRWIVGDPGSQLDIAARASRIVQTRPDLSVDWAELGAVEFRAASIRGLGHFADGKPRQDACGVAFAPNSRWLVGCVADGVSAATYAHQAADIAVATFTREIGNDFAGVHPAVYPEEWQGIVSRVGWQAATDQVSREINLAAEERFRKGFERSGDQESLGRLETGGLPDHDARQVLATTAVVFAVATSPLADGRIPFAVVVAAGDSSAMILSEGTWHPISAVKNAGAEVASSEVRPLPRSTVVVPTAGFLEPGQALVVMTDGIGDPLGSGSGVVGRFLAERWASPPDPIVFANDIAFYRKSFVDDRTAAMVWVKG
jgi:hypothetical protein